MGLKKSVQGKAKKEEKREKGRTIALLILHCSHKRTNCVRTVREGSIRRNSRKRLKSSG